MPEVRERNMLVQVLLMIVTFGIYGVYWFFSTCRELAFLANEEKVSPTLLTILLFIPLVNLYSLYKYAELYEIVSRDHMNKWLLWVISLVFVPAVWFIVQMELNERASSL